MRFQKGHDLERLRSLVKTNGTIRFLDHKNIDLDAKNRHPKTLVQKLWSNTSLCIIIANVTCPCTSHIQSNQDIFQYTKILEVNSFAFAYRLFHEDYSLICRALA